MLPVKMFEEVLHFLFTSTRSFHVTIITSVLIIAVVGEAIDELVIPVRFVRVRVAAIWVAVKGVVLDVGGAVMLLSRYILIK